VDAGGAPLLRHRLDLDGTDPATVSPASMVGATAVGTLLQVAAQWTDPATPAVGAASPTCAVMPLAGPGLLVTALRTDALDLRRDLDAHLPGWIGPRSAGPGLGLSDRGQSLVDATYQALGCRTRKPGVWTR
jgi:urease accessory protein